MTRPTLEDKKEQIAKLPKWAQVLIRNLDRNREDMARKLKEFADDQTPSAVYYEEYVNEGAGAGHRSKRRFVQTDAITIEAYGIRMRVALRDTDAIVVNWEDVGGSMEEIGMVPFSFQAFRVRKGGRK